MESYVPKNCPVNEACQFSSPLISTEQFKEQCWDIVGRELIEFEQDEDKDETKALADELQTDEQTLAELKEVCNIDNLKCDYDKYNYFKTRAFEDFPNDCPLETVKMSKCGKTKLEELYYPPNFLEPFVEDIKEDDNLIPADEVLIHVSIFHPVKRRVQQEFCVHANQKLSELRDVITCPSDNIVLGDFSNNPDLTGAVTSKELTGSSFFFIEQVFYNDTRNPLFRDYSKLIIEWAKDEERYNIPGLGLFTSNEMQNVMFKDLTIRLGYPYLFCHQGNCEHIVVFADMRIVNNSDVQKLTSYPVKIMEGKTKHRKCSVCNIHMIKWKTMNDSLAFEDPSYFCEKCFRYLHYSDDGKKLYPFEAYPCLDMEY